MDGLAADGIHRFSAGIENNHGTGYGIPGGCTGDPIRLGNTAAGGNGIGDEGIVTVYR